MCSLTALVCSGCVSSGGGGLFAPDPNPEPGPAISVTDTRPIIEVSYPNVETARNASPLRISDVIAIRPGNEPVTIDSLRGGLRAPVVLRRRILRSTSTTIRPDVMSGDSLRINGFTAERRSSANLAMISSKELRAVEAEYVNLYVAVLKLREESWLKNREIISADGTRTAIQVVVDGKPVPEGLRVLRCIRTSEVAEVKWYDPRAAQRQWSADYKAGAIVVTTILPTRQACRSAS